MGTWHVDWQRRLRVETRVRLVVLIGVTLLLAAILIGAPIPRLNWRDPWLVMPLIVLTAFAVLTLTSTNQQLSLGALGSAAARPRTMPSASV